MADVHDKETRSYNMSRVKSKDTGPELLVRKFLHANGFRYRLHVKNLPGKPDIVLPKYKTAIFVHGCFWHGHKDCKYFTIPKTRSDWWREKINKNIENDEKAFHALQAAGWKVMEIWGCDLNKKKLENTLSNLLRDLEAEAN